jgi:hypothetical protein
MADPYKFVETESRIVVTKEELKELLQVLNYYIVGGLSLGVMCATVAANGGIIVTRTNYGLPVAPQFFTALVVMFIGLMTGLLAYLILLPAELKLIRRKLRPKILARRLSGKK